jgi:hypothetical protein
LDKIKIDNNNNLETNRVILKNLKKYIYIYANKLGFHIEIKNFDKLSDVLDYIEKLLDIKINSKTLF